MDVDTPPCVKHALYTECCVERDHLQYDITPICKIMSLENSCQKTDMCCAHSGMDPVKCQEVLSGPFAGIVPVLVQNCMNFSISLIPQLQL